MHVKDIEKHTFGGNNGGGKEPIKKETIEAIIEYIALGFSIDKAIAFRRDKGEQTVHAANFFIYMRQFELDEHYHNAYEARKILLQEKLLDEIEAVPERIVGEISYQKNTQGDIIEVPLKFINNTAGVQKIEVKRKIIESMNGRSRRFRMIEGEKLSEQIASVKDRISTHEITPIEGLGAINFLEKEMTLVKFDSIEDELADMRKRMKNIEIRSR